MILKLAYCKFAFHFYNNLKSFKDKVFVMDEFEKNVGPWKNQMCTLCDNTIRCRLTETGEGSLGTELITAEKSQFKWDYIKPPFSKTRKNGK